MEKREKKRKMWKKKKRGKKEKGTKGQRDKGTKGQRDKGTKGKRNKGRKESRCPVAQIREAAIVMPLMLLWPEQGWSENKRASKNHTATTTEADISAKQRAKTRVMKET